MRLDLNPETGETDFDLQRSWVRLTESMLMIAGAAASINPMMCRRRVRHASHMFLLHSVSPMSRSRWMIVMVISKALNPDSKTPAWQVNHIGMVNALSSAWGRCKLPQGDDAASLCNPRHRRCTLRQRQVCQCCMMDCSRLLWKGMTPPLRRFRGWGSCPMALDQAAIAVAVIL